MGSVGEAVKKLHPAYFAMVMSTGIVSIAFKGLGVDLVFLILFFINLAFYAILLPMLLARIAFFTDYFRADLKHPLRGFGFLTFVVATNTLGVQFFLLEFTGIAKILWFLGLISWVLFIYSIYICFISLTAEPIENAVSGATLLTTVSTQSVAVLGSLLAESFGRYSNLVLFISWSFWGAGFVLYLIIIGLVSYRLLFRRMRPEDWTGPYWICMGAVAITALAGSNLVLKMGSSPLFDGLAPATLAITFLAWAIGTWWIPIQVVMDVWKFTRLNISGRVPGWIKIFPWLRLGFGNQRQHLYEPLSWGRVFPMGMYTACTIALSRASDFQFLFVISKYWAWFALAVWVLTFIGTLRSLFKK